MKKAFSKKSAPRTTGHRPLGVGFGDRVGFGDIHLFTGRERERLSSRFRWAAFGAASEVPRAWHVMKRSAPIR